MLAKFVAVVLLGVALAAPGLCHDVHFLVQFEFEYK
jgi:hypothetical protein